MIRVDVHFKQKDEEIIVTPYENYEIGKVYILYVGKNITHNGVRLKIPYKQQFKIIEKL